MNTFSNYLKANVKNSLFLERTNPQEVTDICDGIRLGAAAGYDNINISVVKSTIDIISIPLAHIINLSISSGVVPRELKIARVIPLFKSGDEAVFVNYRPISVLPLFSKFIEKVIYRRFYNFLTKNNFLFDNQYGFRKDHSTDHSIKLHQIN